MFRPIRRQWRRLLSTRVRATLLLVTWVASVALTAMHDDDGLLPQEPSSSSSTACAPEHAVAVVHAVSSGPTITAFCRGGGDCHDPSHHHRPLAHHDVTQCPYCAMLLERPAELPLFVFVPQTTVRFVGAVALLPLSASQRCVFALARGPPSDAARV